MRISQFLLIMCFAVFGGHVSNAAENADTLYRVQTYRAAPGGLVEFIEIHKKLEREGFYESWTAQAPFMLRHSQGDHWDIMLIQPMMSYGKYYSASQMEKRRKAHEQFRDDLQRLDQLTSFREDLFSTGPSLEVLSALFEENDFYHIEIFHALAGKKQELLEQRRIENIYLEGIGVRANTIFVIDGGGDADAMTIGFYTSLQDYAKPSEVEDAAKEQIARDAGFKSRADIGPYLRTLISAHHDTLAVSVP